MFILLFPPIATITSMINNQVGSDFLKKPAIGYTFLWIKTGFIKCISVNAT